MLNSALFVVLNQSSLRVEDIFVNGEEDGDCGCGISIELSLLWSGPSGSIFTSLHAESVVAIVSVLFLFSPICSFSLSSDTLTASDEFSLILLESKEEFTSTEDLKAEGLNMTSDSFDKKIESSILCGGFRISIFLSIFCCD